MKIPKISRTHNEVDAVQHDEDYGNCVDLLNVRVDFITMVKL